LGGRQRLPVEEQMNGLLNRALAHNSPSGTNQRLRVIGSWLHDLPGERLRDKEIERLKHSISLSLNLSISKM
jgi:hypothetical protein